MEKKHRVCKICNRRFASGKAMGGHMRSHLAKLPVPPKPILPSFSSTPPTAPNENTSPPLSTLSFPSAHNHRSVDLNHRELSSEGESPKHLTRRRSKRFRKFPLNTVGSPSDSVSSVVQSERDETLSIEEAAMCLLKLSSDKWVTTPTKEVYYESLDDAAHDALDDDEELEGELEGNDGGVEDMDVVDDDDTLDDVDDEEEKYGGVEDVDVDVDVDEDENNDDDELFCVTNHGAKAQVKYKCETCNKVFKSHQALGGHRANHKNNRCKEEEEKFSKGAGNGESDEKIDHQQRIFECPFCDKVFRSGQALGGHKKVHFTYLAVANKGSETSSSSSAVQLFDLNLPAPEGDGES